jgi:hypothetical protein
MAEYVGTAQPRFEALPLRLVVTCQEQIQVGQEMVRRP